MVTAAGVLLPPKTFANESKLSAMLPDRIRGWGPETPDAVYDRATLFDYIDGGAEVYLSYGFEKVVARRYSKEGAPDIIADLFDMGNSADAYGVYHYSTHENPDPGVGHESEYMGSALYFWKGQYFVSIVALDIGEESDRAVLELGKSIADAIPCKGEKPPIFRFLPQRHRILGPVKYFHTHLVLNRYYFLAEENILLLDRKTEGAVARYKDNQTDAVKEDEPLVVVAVRYTSEESARKAYESFLNNYLPDADRENTAKTENEKWTGIRRNNEFVFIIFDAVSKEEIENFMNQSERNIAEKSSDGEAD